MTTLSRRAYAGALVLLAAGGLVLLFAFGLTWATVEIPVIAGAGDAMRQQAFSGRDLHPGAAMAGWVALAAVAGIVATRSWGRTVVAVLAGLAGLLAVVVSVVHAVSPSRAVDDAVAQLVGPGSDAVAVSTAGWVVGALGGAVVLVAAGWTAARGRAWPTLGARYERRPRGGHSVNPWDAQDLGRDPTDDLVE